MKKAQIGVEHAALLAIVFVIIIVGIVRFADIQRENAGRVYTALVNSQVDNLVDTINRAPVLGEGSRQTVILNLPEEFISANLSMSNKTIIFTLSNEQGLENMIFPTDYTIIDDGIIKDLKPGKRKIYVIALQDDVCLSEDSYCGGECGDGLASDTEVCDLNDFKGNDCNSVNSSYAGGTLICYSDCSGFSEEYCTT